MPDQARRPAAGTVLAFDFGLHRIGVAVGEPELGGVLGVDLEVGLAGPRDPGVAAVRVAEGAEEHGDPVGVDRRRVRSPPVLRCLEDETEGRVRLVQRVQRLLQLVPGAHDVPVLARLDVDL